MSLTYDQQTTFRKQVALAWKRFAPANGLEPSDKAAKDKWYRGVLVEACGADSTLALNHRADFVNACAAFEEIHGQSFYWTLRAAGGTEADQKRRLTWKIREVLTKWDGDEEYALGIARVACRLERKPSFDDLTPEQLATVLRIINAQIKVIAGTGATGKEAA